MGQVTVRNLDDRVLARLRERARAHHRSLEAELRTILSEAVAPVGPALREELDRIRQALRSRWSADTTALIRQDRRR